MCVAVAHGQRLLASTLHCMSWTKPGFEILRNGPDKMEQGARMCRGLIFAGLGALTLTCSRGLAQTVPADASKGEDGQWTMAAKDFANTRFSGLKQITSENVKSLK